MTATAGDGSTDRGPDGAVQRLWDEVVGQPEATSALRMAATDPVHAYLLVGPEGSGKRSAALAFAAEVIAAGSAGQSADEVAARIADGTHPSVRVVEREGPRINAATAREVVRSASMAPPSGHLQVFVLDEFHLVDDAAPIMLKAIEEPSASTMFVVLAEEVTEPLVTIASRCVQIRFNPVPLDALEQRLRSEGVEPGVAAQAAVGAEGSLRRARLLAGDPELVQRRGLWRDAPARLDGTGATVCVLADELLDSLDGVLEPLRGVHGDEVADFDATVELTGESSRGARKVMEDRHKRELRRLRVGELRSGASALLAGYRDDAVSGTADAVESFSSAAEAVARFEEALQWNANEQLALRALLVSLPRRG
ncbi:MAG: hypothetical protein M9942_09420 [Microthrixaceae bacterium]|nr:hypothetical protein [Microthrixaceae bacterium]